MSNCTLALRARYALIATLWLLLANSLLAQRFVDPGFRIYAVRSTTPDVMANSLRTFLSDREGAGEQIEIVPDERGNRILVRGSQEIQQLVSQFLQATDKSPVPDVLAQTTRTVHGYPTNGPDDLQRRVEALRQRFANREDVRIAADERTLQVIIHAPQDVHQMVADWWTTQQPMEERGLPPNRTDAVVADGNRAFAQVDSTPTSDTLQLTHVTWRELLRDLRSVQPNNPAVRAQDNGNLEVTLTSASGTTTRMEINPDAQLVQLTGPRDTQSRWLRVIAALDVAPTVVGEARAAGQLGDARPATITRTIAMLGGNQSLKSQFGLPKPTANQPGVAGFATQLFRESGAATQLAQANNNEAAPAGDDGQEFSELVGDAGDDDSSAGSFLGPVRIEFLEGTDIYIVRGQKQDVDRVMQIIQEIEQRTAETEPTVKILTLKYANSQAVSTLLTQLNQSAVLSSRQGDISVTPLVKPNALLLIGRDAGVTAIEELVARLDVEVESTTLFEVFPLKFVPAVDAERTISNVYNQQGLQATDPVGLQPRVRAVADFRSNSLVVYGSPRDLEEVGGLLRKLDVKSGTSVNEIRVFRLKNAFAEEVEEALNLTIGRQSQQAQQGGVGGQGGFGGATGGAGATVTQPFSSQRSMTLMMKVFDKASVQMLESGILTSVSISANERANALIVSAPEGSMDLIAEIIRQIDELPAQEALIRVFTITNGDAAILTEMLTELFAANNQQQASGPAVQSATGETESTLVPLRFVLDPRTNSIIASGTAPDLRVVEAILLRLDSNDVRRRRNYVYELQYQLASNIATAITQFVQDRRAALSDIAPDAITAYELLDQEVVVVAEDISNKVIISATDRYFEEVLQLVRDLDKRPDMVMVQCLIAEVTLNSTEEMGVELGIQDSLLFDRSVNGVPGFNFNNQPLGNNVTGGDVEHTAGQALSNFGLGRTNSDLGYGGLVLSASSESISVLIRALQEARRLDVLSRPQVMMLNNSQGEVLIGASVPFIQNTQNTGFNITNTVEFIDVGLVLNVVPRISPDGLVVMTVLADKSQLGSIEDGIPISVSATGEVLRQPQINRTRAETIVSARDGQTVILGGLITKSRSSSERKVPYLGDVPFFGRLFRTDSIAESRTELLIILTPHIIRDEEDLDRVNTEEYARMSWCLGNVIETHGEIHPYGGSSTVDRDVIYSELGEVYQGNSIERGVDPMQSGANFEPIPDGYPSNSPTWAIPEPANAPLVPEGAGSGMSSPRSTAPPTPDRVPELGPQARIPSVLVPPKNQASVGRDGKVFGERPGMPPGVQHASGTIFPNYARPVNYQASEQPEKTTTESKRDGRVFRLGEIQVQ